MNYRILTVTPLQENCSLVWCEGSKKAALIDPGGEPQRLLAAVEEAGLQLQMVLLTHGHVDHVGAASAIAGELKVPILGPHQADAFWLERLPQQAARFGLDATPAFTPTRWLHDGEQIALGDLTLEVIHCPGHTPGHVVFFCRSGQTAFVGDVLFHRSIGRTDFPQGDYDTLIDCITRRLLPLGDGVSVVPGHGPNTSLGEERRHNPFLQG
ncbi:MAG: MBL fold metallo-hydrolase [Gammaproteobacteria bacterium]|nr:MBL fold metallo-hydrolase [Gammaproteobacteria bacterium]